MIVKITAYTLLSILVGVIAFLTTYHTKAVAKVLLFFSTWLAVYLLALKIKLEYRVAQLERIHPDIPIYRQYFNFALLPLLGALAPNWTRALPKGFQFRTPYKYYNNSSKHLTVVVVTPTSYDYYIANKDYIKEIASRYTDFKKPIDFYYMINVFGPNVVGTEDEEWKRHRRTFVTQFNDKTHELVCNETIATCLTMFENWDENATDTGEVLVDAREDMLNLALIVMSTVGFGKRLDWDDNDGDEKYIETVATFAGIYIALPRWVWSIPHPKIQHIKHCFENFQKQLKGDIKKARTEYQKSGEKLQKANMLFSLVAAAVDDDDTYEDQYIAKNSKYAPLTNDELFSNVFILLLAGHETSARTLHAALVKLAFHPEIQEKLHQEVVGICGKDGLPKYADWESFSYAQCVMYETLRLHAPVVEVPKYSEKEQQVGGLTIMANSHIRLHVAGMHMSPMYFEDPERFYPDRFLGADGKPDKTKYIGSFSEGARKCMGKKFSVIEVVFTLALISQRYKWTIKDIETLDRTKIFEKDQRLTVYLPNTPNLVFSKRP